LQRHQRMPTFPLYTATTKQAFSVMTIVKIRLRNKIDDDFFIDYLMLYTERKIVAKFSADSIIDDF